MKEDTIKLLMTQIEAALKKREYAMMLLEESDKELYKASRLLQAEQEKNAGSRT